MAEILPHERVLLIERLQLGTAENAQAAIDMANAIENGNVWHDNSEYDEAIERMKSIDSRFGHLADLTRNATVIAYPPQDEASIALGSLVALRTSGDRFSVVIVGQNFVGSERYLDAWEQEGNDRDDLSVTAVGAPLGAVLLGRRDTDVVSYEVEGREFSATVDAVDQNWVRQVFATDLALHAKDPVIANFV